MNYTWTAHKRWLNPGSPSAWNKGIARPAASQWFIMRHEKTDHSELEGIGISIFDHISIRAGKLRNNSHRTAEQFWHGCRVSEWSQSPHICRGTNIFDQHPSVNITDIFHNFDFHQSVEFFSLYDLRQIPLLNFIRSVLHITIRPSNLPPTLLR